MALSQPRPALIIKGVGMRLETIEVERILPTNMTIFDRFTEDFVQHQNLLIPTRSMDGLIAQSCANLAIITGMSEFPIYIPGSATLIKYRGRYFMVCTRHQLGNTDEKEFEFVGLPISDLGEEGVFVTSSGAKWTKSQIHETDYHDLVGFDFTETCEAHPRLKSRFFEISSQHPNFREDWVVGVIAYGFPTKIVNYDYEARRINSGRLRVACKFSASQDVDPAVHALELLEPLDIDPDGMSGGPTFFVVMIGMQAQLHMVGINVTGSVNALRVIKTGAVLTFLDSMFTHPLISE